MADYQRTEIDVVTSPVPPPVEVINETPPSTSDGDVGEIEKGVDTNTNNATPTESTHDVSSSDTAQQTIVDEVVATQSLAIAKGNALLEQDDDKHEENAPEIMDIEKGTSIGTTSSTQPPSTTTQPSSQLPPSATTVMGSSPSDNINNIETRDQVQPGAVAILGPSGHAQNTPANNPQGNPVMDAPVSDPTPILEATRVEDDSNEVYEATEVTDRPWWKKNRYIYGGMGLLVGAALALGLSLGLNGGSSNNLTEELSPTQSPYPSLSPTSSSAPSLSPTSSAAPTPVIYFKQLGQDINGKEGGSLLGGTVSMSSDGEVLAVSAGEMGNNGPGYVTMYKWNETLVDYEPFGETLTGDAAGDGFGYSSSVSEDAQTLVIGAPFHDMNGENSGHVKIYMWNETALSYNQVGDTLYGTNEGDTFGEVVATSSDGKTVAVSSTGGDTNGEDSGQVTLYKWDENVSNYEQVDKFLGDGAGDSFGYSISLSSNGKTLAVGSPYKDIQTNELSSGSTKGQVNLFVWDDESLNYRPAATITAPQETYQFGWSVSLSEDSRRLAVGLNDLVGESSFNDENVDAAGKVIVYELNLNEDLLQYKQLGELVGDSNKDDFGASVSLNADGKTLAVGAPKDDTYGIQSGSAKVFKWDEATLSYTQLYDSAVYGEGPDNYFGGPVSIARDGKTFAVGALGNGKNGPYSGQLQVFSIPTSEDEESVDN